MPFSMSERYDWLMSALQLGLDGPHELRLRELPTEPAQVPFELPQLPELLGERHCNL